METTNKILMVFTGVVLMFFLFEVMVNTNKVNQLNVPQPPVVVPTPPPAPVINITDKQTFNPKISLNSSIIRQNNNNNNNNNNRRINRRRVQPIHINVNTTSSSRTPGQTVNHYCDGDTCETR